jgi:hypothetical protein
MKQPEQVGRAEPVNMASKRRHAVLGIRMTIQRATDVKVEAAERGMSVATLFEEIWQIYVRAGANE